MSNSGMPFFFPVISTPSAGHEHVPEVCRIHPAVPPRSGSMTFSRLHPHFRPRVEARISIDLFPPQHMKRRLRQVACHRSHSSRVPFAGPQPRVQRAAVEEPWRDLYPTPTTEIIAALFLPSVKLSPCPLRKRPRTSSTYASTQSSPSIPSPSPKR